MPGCWQTPICWQISTDMPFRYLDGFCVYTVIRLILCEWTSGAHSEMQFWLLKWRSSGSMALRRHCKLFKLKFLDFTKNLKPCLSSVGKIYIVCALLRYSLTCLYGNNTSEFFRCNPPDLFTYFAWYYGFFLTEQKESIVVSTEIIYSFKIYLE